MLATFSFIGSNGHFVNGSQSAQHTQDGGTTPPSSRSLLPVYPGKDMEIYPFVLWQFRDPPDKMFDLDIFPYRVFRSPPLQMSASKGELASESTTCFC